MAKFKYTAQNDSGKRISGKMDAADKDELYAKLRARNIYMISAREESTKPKMKRLKSKELADFCRQLGTLLKAGVSLVRALNIMCHEETLKPVERQTYEELLRQIRQGVALSSAMEALEGTFPELLINMFKSAELSGNMDKTAMQMAVYFEKDYKMKKKINGAMIYPCILLIMLVAVVIFIVSYIIPQFDDLFSTMEQLPAPTRMLLAISDAFKYHWTIILAVFIAIVILIIFALKQPKVRLAFDRFKLRLPYVGKLLMIIYTSRFSRTLSTLYSAGLPMITALTVGCRTVGNKYIESQFDKSIATVRGGGSLSEAIASIDGFSKKLSDSIMIGEETGSLESMLVSMADTLEYESEMAISKLVTMLEPVMIITMGIVVGFVMISVLLPVYNSYSAIENQAYY